jgi:hypothetical protein
VDNFGPVLFDARRKFQYPGLSRCWGHGRQVCPTASAEPDQATVIALKTLGMRQGTVNAVRTLAMREGTVSAVKPWTCVKAL